MLLYRLLLIAASIGVGGCAVQASKDPADRPVAPFETHVFQVDGDPAHPASLRVTLLTPQGPGPFPLIVWNHGSTGNPSQQDMSDYINHFGTYYFLSRGYAVALPLMRGFGGSEGRLSVSGCRFDALAADDARDIVAVLNRIAREPGIDARRIIVAGGSFGGWNALAVGARNDPRRAEMAMETCFQLERRIAVDPTEKPKGGWVARLQVAAALLNVLGDADLYPAKAAVFLTNEINRHRPASR